MKANITNPYDEEALGPKVSAACLHAVPNQKVCPIAHSRDSTLHPIQQADPRMAILTDRLPFMDREELCKEHGYSARPMY